MTEAVVIGVSAGGLKALSVIAPMLPKDLLFPVIVVQHVKEGSDPYMAEHLGRNSVIRVKEADEKESVKAGTMYFAPAGYHLLVETDRTFSLSDEPPVQFSRPSIDVLFESAADVYGAALAGVVLTGANSDGAAGLAAIKDAGGTVAVQDPETAESSAMPNAALKAAKTDNVFDLVGIGSFLCDLNMKSTAEHLKTDKEWSIL